MNLRIEMTWVVALMLVSVRLGTMFIMTPVFGGIALPAMVRVLLLMGLSGALLAGLQQGPPPLPQGPWMLALAVTAEAVVGAAMAFGLFAAFATFQFAGKLLDVQIGFVMGSVFDPATRALTPVLGTALGMLATALFFAVDGHHLLLKSVFHSLQVLPPGTWRFWIWEPAWFTQAFGAMFVLGLTLVAPVVVALLLVDIGLGVVSRTMPQLNVFTVGIPAKIGVGLVVLAACLLPMASVMARVFDGLFAFLQRLMD